KINCIFNVKINEMYSVTINKEKYEVEKTGDIFTVNEVPIHWELEIIDHRIVHIIKDNASHLVELVDVNSKEKTLTLKLNNKISKIRIQDNYDLLLEKLGMNVAADNRIMDLKAPMPGLILDILVNVGDSVKKGDPVLVLEAMKMENILKSAGEGEVKHILVEIGSSVEKNQVLIQF